MENNIKEQIQKFSEMINKYPNIKEFYINRARLYEDNKEYEKALADYKKTLPNYYIYSDIATICERNGLTKEAEAFYTEDINTDESNVKNYIRRAYFYTRIGEVEKALSDCATVLALSPDNETVLTLKKILTWK